MSTAPRKCEFKGLVSGCARGQACPLLDQPCGHARNVAHARYHPEGQPPTPASVVLAAEQLKAMDDTMEVAHA